MDDLNSNFSKRFTKSKLSNVSKRLCSETSTSNHFCESEEEEPLSTISTKDIDFQSLSSAKTCNNKSRCKIDKEKSPRWTWSDEMVEVLLENLVSYKTDMDYKGLDFEKDLPAMYSSVRAMMGQMYPPEDFGPFKIQPIESNYLSTEELLVLKRKIDNQEKQKKEGYNRVKSKIKELRSGYKTAIDKGTRSGSGRFVQVHFEKLREIWSGSPSVGAIPHGHSSLNLTNESKIDDMVIKDTKRDKMKKKLSAYQRDIMQLDLAREEITLKRSIIQAMEQSSKQTQNAIEAMANSVTSIGDSIKEGLSILANSFMQNQQMQWPNYNMVHTNLPTMSNSFSPPLFTKPQ